ncbi:type I secretion system permease/ATPase [Deltaproteobacteria bacterium TL4]
MSALGKIKPIKKAFIRGKDGALIPLEPDSSCYSQELPSSTISREVVTASPLLTKEVLLQKPATVDSGLSCLMMIVSFFRISADKDQLQRSFSNGTAPMGLTEIMRAAKTLKMKVRQSKGTWQKITNLPLPLILQKNDGTFLTLARAEEQQVLTYDPLKSEPQWLSQKQLEPLWNGNLLLLTYREKGGESTEKKFDLSWFLPAVFKYKSILSEIVIASFLVQIFGLVSPLFSQVVIDKVLVHHGLSSLDVLALGLLIVTVFEAILSMVRSYLFAHTGNRIDVVLGMKLYKHLAHLPLTYFENRRVGNIVNRIDEMLNIRSFLTNAPLTLFLDILFGGVFIAAMFVYSPQMAWIALAFLPLFIILTLIMTPLIRKNLVQQFKVGAENKAFVVEMLTGMNTIKSLALETEMMRRWENKLAQQVTAGFRTSHMSSIASSLGQIIQKTSILVLMWTGARLVIEGNLTLGQLIAFNMMSGRVNGPILSVVSLWHEFQQMKLSVKHLSDLFETECEQVHDPAKATLPPIKGKVQIENAVFRYKPNGPEILSDVSFTVRPGMKIGIVGRSGSGKSTITKIIQGLYKLERGRVLIDGVDVQQFSPNWLRAQIGVVLQDNFLFSGSIRENLMMAKPGVSMEEIQQVCHLAGAHEFIITLPQGYDTPVGERGSALSGGQKQRVAIARALLRNPRLLIFDEATSALDYESERIINDNLNTICEGRTVFLIAHRLSTVMDADCILVLEQGRLVEMGVHEQLLAKDGIYAHLYHQQMGKLVK